MDYLLSFDVSWPHLTGAERRSALCIHFLSPPSSKKTPVPKGARVSACSAGAPTALCFMHHRFNKHRQHPRRSPLPILPAEGTKLSPSSPLRLIPGFTSSALRKFNCNLGLDKILLLQKVGAT